MYNEKTKNKHEIQPTAFEQISALFEPLEAEFEIPYGVDETRKRIEAEMKRGSWFLSNHQKIDITRINDETIRFIIRKQTREMSRYRDVASGTFYANGDGSTLVRFSVGTDYTFTILAAAAVGISIAVIVIMTGGLPAGLLAGLNVLLVWAVGLAVAYFGVSQARRKVVNEIKRALL